MNEVVKKIIIKAGLGFSLGLLVGGGFMLMEGPPDAYLGATGVWAGILELFVCGVYGLVVMEGQLLYDIEYYSLMRATLTHFLLFCLDCFCLDCLLAGSLMMLRYGLLLQYTLLYLYLSGLSYTYLPNVKFAE